MVWRADEHYRLRGKAGEVLGSMTGVRIGEGTFRCGGFHSTRARARGGTPLGALDIYIAPPPLEAWGAVKVRRNVRSNGDLKWHSEAARRVSRSQVAQ